MSQANNFSIATLFGGSTDPTALLGPPDEETPAKPSKNPVPPNTPVTPIIKPSWETHNLPPYEEELDQDSIRLPSPAVKLSTSANTAEETSTNDITSEFPSTSDLDHFLPGLELLQIHDGEDHSQESAALLEKRQNGTSREQDLQQGVRLENKNLSHSFAKWLGNGEIRNENKTLSHFFTQWPDNNPEPVLSPANTNTTNTETSSANANSHSSTPSRTARPNTPEAPFTSTSTTKPPTYTPNPPTSEPHSPNPPAQTPLFQAPNHRPPTQHDIDSALTIHYEDLPTTSPCPPPPSTSTSLSQSLFNWFFNRVPLEAAATPEFLGYEWGNWREEGDGYDECETVDDEEDEDALGAV
ncbi:MAG: hypothetical protein Q9186_004934 [Xanthomendoza sp. 1 TL-2023]